MRQVLVLLLPLVLAASVRADTVRVVPLKSKDLVFSPERNRLYASIPSAAGAGGNAVAAIDPVAGAVEGTAFVGSEPGPLALSDSSSFLYVGLDGAAAVRRVNLATGLPDQQFTLGSDPFFGPLFAHEIRVVPGQESSIAVSLRRNNVIPSHGGVAVYDNGTRRAQMTPDHTGSNRLAFSGNAVRLYGYNDESTEFGFRRLAVSQAGVREISVTRQIIQGGSRRIQFANGLLYSSGGEVVDPETRQLVGTFAGVGDDAVLWVAPADNRAYFLVNSEGTWVLRAFDLQTLLPTGTLALASVQGTPSSLVRWGGNGLAFRTSEDQLFLVETALVGTPAPVADLEVTAEVSASTVVTRQQLVYTLTVTNHGQVPATAVKLVDVFEAGAVYISSTVAQGNVTVNDDTFTVDLGTLAAGQSTVVTLRVEPREAGTLLNTTAVRAGEADPISANNFRVLTTEVVDAPPANLVLTTTGTPTSMVIGSDLTYKLRITNLGPNPATGVVLQQDLPDGATLISTHTTQGTITVEAGALTAALGAIPFGGEVTVTVVVHPLVIGWYSSTAAVTGNEPDPVSFNNSAYLSTLVSNPAGPDLTANWGLLDFRCTGVGAAVRCQISGSLAVSNQGSADSTRRFVTRVYVSTDGNLSEDDRLVKTFKSGRLRVGRPVVNKLKVKLPRGIDASGSYVIAVVDAENAVPETDETNNRSVGPARFPMRARAKQPLK